jgi:hydrogenase maturation protease
MVYIFGIGNILMGDDGFGSLFAQRYGQEIEALFPRQVKVVDVGTHTIPVLDLLRGCTYLIFIDTLTFNQQPGESPKIKDKDNEFIVLDKDFLTDFGKNKVIMSSHSGGIQEIMQAAELISILPEKIQLIGVKPVDISTQVGLSPSLEPKLPKLKEYLIGLLAKEFS